MGVLIDILERAVRSALEIPSDVKEVGRGFDEVDGFEGASEMVFLGAIDTRDEENRSMVFTRLVLIGCVSSCSSSLSLDSLSSSDKSSDSCRPLD